MGGGGFPEHVMSSLALTTPCCLLSGLHSAVLVPPEVPVERGRVDSSVSPHSTLSHFVVVVFLHPRTRLLLPPTVQTLQGESRWLRSSVPRQVPLQQQTQNRERSGPFFEVNPVFHWRAARHCFALSSRKDTRETQAILCDVI